MRATALLLALALFLPMATARSHSHRPRREGRSSAHPAVVLIYHHFLTDEEARKGPGKLDDLTLSASQFKEQLDLLKRLQATPISLEELGRHVRGEKEAPPRSYAIVIDDGYESIHRVAWPILKERSIPASIALIVLATDDPRGWARRYPGSTPHLTWAQIAEMQRPVRVGRQDRILISVESHTYDRHENLALAERWLANARVRFNEELAVDLTKARELIRTRTGGLSNADFLIWPHGLTSPTLIEAARKAGHTGTFAGLGEGVWPRETEPMRIPRIHAGTGVRGLGSLEHALENAGWIR